MKINEGFKLRSVAGENVVVPLGSAVSKLNGIIKLNDMGAFLWKCLQNDRTEEELISAVMQEYEADRELVKKDVHSYLEKLRSIGCID